MTDFAALLKRLNAGGVEFIIVGGVAAAVHGASRLTLDLDIVYLRSPENVLRLVRSLEDLHPYLRGAPPGLPFRFDSETVERGLNFTLSTTLGDIDLLGEITGGAYSDLLPNTDTIRVFDIECRCLSVRKLIQVKRACGRPKDLEGIAELEAIEQEQQNS